MLLSVSKNGRESFQDYDKLRRKVPFLSRIKLWIKGVAYKHKVGSFANTEVGCAAFSASRYLGKVLLIETCNLDK